MDWIAEEPFRSLLILAAALLAGAVAHAMSIRALQRLSRRSAVLREWSTHLSYRAGRIMFMLLAVYLVMPLVHLPPAPLALLDRLVDLGVIAAVARLAIKGIDLAGDMVVRRHAAPGPQASRILTQVRVFRRIAAAIIIVVAIAAMLMTFATLRRVGVSILASAGAAGLIVGLASQKTLSLLIIGIQLALAQPIRLGDEVVVEGEQGEIEEITFTYVVVRLLDNRRLILPVSWFIDKPFQNLTRGTDGLSGYVTLKLNAAVDVDALRGELTRILADSPRWDGRQEALVVTDQDTTGVTLRATVSAKSAGELWKLRCEVRERLLGFVREKHAGALMGGG